MITIDLNIDFSDLMNEEDKSETNTQKMLDKVKDIISYAILSSLEDVSIDTPKGPKSFIRGETQRRVDRLLDALEDCEDGLLIMPDKRMEFLQEKWTNRLGRPVAGDLRKLYQRIDRRICSDAYKDDETEILDG